jgi:hypothetical protein
MHDAIAVALVLGPVPRRRLGEAAPARRRVPLRVRRQVQFFGGGSWIRGGHAAASK